ncbi:MAG TPA: nuclear transport factor 2 family protein [Candidatus Limnocylindria bacterium]|jgi:ketosteroid isomerase-like protein
MDMHPNARILHEASQNAGDFQAFFDMLADDVVWHEIGRDEPTRGKQALMERFQSEGANWEISGDEHAVVADDQHAVQLMNVTATRDGKTFHYRTAEIYHMRDGKVTERWAFSDDTAAINAFFG